jgi:hypothetical protein
LKTPICNKYVALKKSGAAGDSFSELENRVLDLVGRESAIIMGIENKSNPPSFAKKSMPLNDISNLGDISSMDDSSVEGDRTRNNFNYSNNFNFSNNHLNETLVSTQSQFELDPLGNYLRLKLRKTNYNILSLLTKHSCNNSNSKMRTYGAIKVNFKSNCNFNKLKKPIASLNFLK